MWWGGFLVIGILLFGPSVGLFCFKPPAYEDNEEKAIGNHNTTIKLNENDNTKNEHYSKDNLEKNANNVTEKIVKK